MDAALGVLLGEPRLMPEIHALDAIPGGPASTCLIWQVPPGQRYGDARRHVLSTFLGRAEIVISARLHSHQNLSHKFRGRTTEIAISAI